MYSPFAWSMTPKILTIMRIFERVEMWRPKQQCSIAAVKRDEEEEIVWMMGMGRQNMSRVTSMPWPVLDRLRQLAQKQVLGFLRSMDPPIYTIIPQLAIKHTIARMRLVSRKCILCSFGQMKEETQARQDTSCRIQESLSLLMNEKIYGRVIIGIE